MREHVFPSGKVRVLRNTWPLTSCFQQDGHKR